MENKKLSVIIIGNNNIDGCLENIYKQSYINDMELIAVSYTHLTLPTKLEV